MRTNVKAAVVIAAKAGRLGNRLFLSAYFMANALSRGYRLLNPALGEYAPYFEGGALDPFCRFPNSRGGLDVEVAAQCRDVYLALLGSALWMMPRARTLDIRNTIDAVDGVYDLNGPEFSTLLEQAGIIVVKGWKFRDDTNLVRYHAEIGRYFRPVDQIRERAESTISKARSRGDEVIGVHIRQGDYRDWKNGVHYFETEQYAHWMREMASLDVSKKPVFLLCASDPVDGSCFQGLDVVMGPGSVIGDLHSLSLCDRIIAPPSTFSTWASYAGRVPLCMLQHHTQQLSMDSFAMHDRV